MTMHPNQITILQHMKLDTKDKLDEVVESENEISVP